MSSLRKPPPPDKSSDKSSDGAFPDNPCGAPQGADWATKEQLLELRRRKGDLKVTAERWTLALARYGVASARYLTTTQAQQLIAAMAARLTAKAAHLAACAGLAAGLVGGAGGEADDAVFAGEDGWAAPLRDLEQTFGSDAVREASLNTLGYPATWSTSSQEFTALRRALAPAPPDAACGAAAGGAP
jgi:hypothetical protein